METIKMKIAELLKVSSEKLIGTKDFGTRFDKKLKKQNELIEELRVLARAEKTLLGRTQRFPMADSYALYLITKVNKRTVELTWLDYCDAWVDDRTGYKGTISKEYVQKQINFDDWWASEAEKKKVMKLSPPLGLNKICGKEFEVTAEE
jgi:hypothetical protein